MGRKYIPLGGKRIYISNEEFYNRLSKAKDDSRLDWPEFLNGMLNRATQYEIEKAALDRKNAEVAAQLREISQARANMEERFKSERDEESLRIYAENAKLKEELDLLRKILKLRADE